MPLDKLGWLVKLPAGLTDYILFYRLETEFRRPKQNWKEKRENWYYQSASIVKESYCWKFQFYDASTTVKIISGQNSEF